MKPKENNTIIFKNSINNFENFEEKVFFHILLRNNILSYVISSDVLVLKKHLWFPENCSIDARYSAFDYLIFNSTTVTPLSPSPNMPSLNDLTILFFLSI